VASATRHPLETACDHVVQPWARSRAPRGNKRQTRNAGRRRQHHSSAAVPSVPAAAAAAPNFVAHAARHRGTPSARCGGVATARRPPGGPSTCPCPAPPGEGRTAPPRPRARWRTPRWPSSPCCRPACVRGRAWMNVRARVRMPARALRRGRRRRRRRAVHAEAVRRPWASGGGAAPSRAWPSGACGCGTPTTSVCGMRGGVRAWKTGSVRSFLNSSGRASALPWSKYVLNQTAAT